MGELLEWLVDDWVFGRVGFVQLLDWCLIRCVVGDFWVFCALVQDLCDCVGECVECFFGFGFGWFDQ